MAKTYVANLSTAGKDSLVRYEKFPSGPDNQRVRVSIAGVDGEVESTGIAWNDFVLAMQRFMNDINSFLLKE